jgi:hypothetical protein
MLYVLSVPHTGSRTLLNHLGVKSWEDHVQQGGLLHFGLDTKKIHALGWVKCYIPVRNPIETLASWHSRRLSPDRALRCMAELVDYYNPNARYMVVEPLQGRIRTGRPRVRGSVTKALEVWTRATPQVKAFYEKYYGEIQAG